MHELAFVSFDPKTKVQSASVRRTVRSKAAKFTAPKRKAKPATAKQRAAVEHVLARQTVDEEDEVQPIRSHTGFAFRPVTTKLGLMSPALTRGSYASSEVSDETRSSQGRSSPLMLQPTDPLLLFQPALALPYSALLNSYYLTNMAVNIPDLDYGTPGLLRAAWYPFVLMNDGLLHVILLLAGCSFVNTRELSQATMVGIRSCLIELKANAYHHVRRMIVDSDNCNSDESIAAVIKIASYESMFGATENFHLHMGALKKLVAGRGGINELGLNGLLGRMVLWVDYQASCLLNSQLHFPEEAHGLPKPMEFGPDSFVGCSDVDP